MYRAPSSKSWSRAVVFWTGEAGRKETVPLASCREPLAGSARLRGAEGVPTSHASGVLASLRM